MSEELKPCPFCGCDEPMVMEHTSSDWVIHCKKCHAKTGRHHTFQGAVYSWNTRHSPEILPEWAIKEIQMLKENNPYSWEKGDADMNWGYNEALETVLSIRKPEAHS